MLAIFGGKPVRDKPIPPWPIFHEEYSEKLLNVLRNGGFSELTGEVSDEFAKEFAEKMGAKYGLTVSNGTSAIHLALIGLGVNPTDEVLVPAHTFIGSATPVLMQNAIPVFVDVDEKTYTMDPEDLERKITDRSKALIVVHLNGNPANMDGIMEVAKKHNLKVIEDCAQAHGAKYGERHVGTIGDVGTFSFWEDKIITTAGEGGMVITNDFEVFQKMKAAKSHGEWEFRKGEERKYLHAFLGYNYRMTEFQSMYGLLELKHLDEYVEKRRENAEYLTRELGSFPGISTPVETEKGFHVYYKYIIKIDEDIVGKSARWIKDAVKAEGIEISERYPTPLYEQPVFKDRKTYGDSSWPYECTERDYNTDDCCPKTKEISGKLLTLYVHPTVDEEYLKDVVSAFEKVWSYLEVD